MKIETKFDFGQRVYYITYSSERRKEICKTCEGKGYFYHNNVEISCPTCWSDGFLLKEITKKWHLSQHESFVIQKIGTEHYNPNNKKWQNHRNWVYYMAADSGSMINENDCFASEEEALEECEKRNKMTENEQKEE